ncbi:hypothetical protein HII31_05502 [Pseudocercospora fuligena]|uniref:Sulfotransferase domain-containing protein n=1 Tax=Pseudocercospora fuligena TaxID=685502 RepID=A0A8H6RL81_9PEZI|nr:hypothetical protein HII31_05502 [Pseudocercospora fuligena]
MTGTCTETNGHAFGKQQRKIFLAYFPRAAHHLFMRMFSGHPELSMIEVMEHVDAIVPQTIQLSGKPTLSSASEDCKALKETWKNCWPKWQDHVRRLEQQGKRVMSSFTFAFLISPAGHNVWLHPGQKTSEMDEADWWRLPDQSKIPTNPSNPTIFSDTFLQDHIPVLLIRHPALAFPSTTRVASQYFEATGGIGSTFMNLILRYRWMVILYDYYHNNPNLPEPVILDSDDLMYNREAVAEFCKELELDPENMKYEWAKTKVDVVYAREDIFVDTLANSEAVVSGKSSEGIDVDVEMVKWRAEFGDERAEMLRKRVDEAMEDYWFLRNRGIGAQMKSE